MKTAIYARFSSDRQSETSIEAQVRLCRLRAEALGLEVLAIHSDHAVSGSTPVEQRPAGRALLADGLAGRYDVLLLEGLDRLSRDHLESERIVRRLEHRGIRIVGVSDGYDTASGKGRKILRGVRGLLNEVYLDDLRDKVHRTLAAKAARGRHVAGLSYGYTSVPDGDDRALVVLPDQAAIVREIFARFAEGESCQRIAADLNRRGVRGPRGHTWSVSAIYGSPAKLAGILNNELYIGRYVWNRSQWVKDPDTGKRTRIDRPHDEWQVRDVSELAIVDRELWDGVRARFGVGDRKRGGVSKTLFGGLLRCSKCGGAMIAVDAGSYGCAARKDRGETVCSGTRSPRKATDQRLVSAVRDQLSSAEAIAQVRREAAELLAHVDAEEARRTRITHLQGEIARLTDAIAQMGLSEGLRTRLDSAERELRSLNRTVDAKRPTVDEVVARYRAALLRLEEALAADIESARIALQQLLGRVTVDQRGKEVWATVETKPAAMLLAAGSKMDLVAGEGFEPSTFGL